MYLTKYIMGGGIRKKMYPDDDRWMMKDALKKMHMKTEWVHENVLKTI